MKQIQLEVEDMLRIGAISVFQDGEWEIFEHREKRLGSLPNNKSEKSKQLYVLPTLQNEESRFPEISGAEGISHAQI